MKLLLCLIVAVLAAVAVAQRFAIETTSMDWSSAMAVPVAVAFTVTTKKDLLVYPLLNDTGIYLSMRRRASDGSYVEAATFPEPFNDPSLITFTNGNWVGVMMGGGMLLFNVDENDQLSTASTLPLVSGNVLSDDTLVGYDPVLVDGNYTIRTYQYSAENMNWTEVADAALKIPFQAVVQLGAATYRVYDNHLVIIDITDYPQPTIDVQIYERQADLSWDLTETVPINGSGVNIYYNGVDTLINFALAVEGNAAGVVFFYTKINGEWVEQVFSTLSVGYRPPGYFGLFIDFVGPNNVVITAGLEGYTGSGGSPVCGRVLLVSRNSEGLWEPALDLVGPNLFGVGVGVNDYDIVIPSLVIGTLPVVTFYTAPFCLIDPMNVTCNELQATNCSDVIIPEMYTINNPQCGAPVTTTLNGVGLVDNQEITADFTFTRGYGADYSCTATVTCPAPPVAPVADVAPVAVVAPTKVSGGNVLQFGLASVLACAAMLV